MAEQKLASKGLARRLVWSFSAFVLFATLAIAGWMTWSFQRQSLEELQELAATNVEFITELRLPKTRELARQLAHILDLGVGFHFRDQGEGDWPAELTESIESLARESRPTASRASGFEIGVAPFAEGDVSLILVRETKPLLATFAGSVFGPALLFTFACGVLAFWTGRRIVQPIGRLVNWLPNLDVEPDRVPDPIPGSITGRSDEIGELAHSLEKTGERLRREQELRRQSERLATLGRIATSLAHEIKNPAAAIGLHAQLLEAKVDPDGTESLALIGEEVERITDLINQWLFVARAKPARREAHDLKELIESVGRRLGPVLEHAQAQLKIGTPGDGGSFPVSVDAPRIEQAFRNLIVNAFQAMPTGGEVRVCLEAGDQEITVAVEDEGPGFSESALERFGEPFFSEREGGMGIGLTLAREVIQAHGGSLEPDRDPHRKGGRVICQLPREGVES